MTKHLTKADPVAWKQALVAFKAARVDFKALKDGDDATESDLTCLRYSDAERALLVLAAPDINGVIEKLMVFFEADLRCETEESVQKITAIGDLRRIQILSS